MSRISTKVRASLTCVAVVVTITACGAPAPEVAAPDVGPDLLQALPTSAPPAVTLDPPNPSPAPAGSPPKAAASGPSRKAPAKQPSRVKPVSAPGGPTSQPGWRPVGGDEFNGADLDVNAWNRYNSKGGFGNGLRRPEAISQSDGLLKITAKGEVSGGMGHGFGQLYGRWEFRARTDPGRGYGSAILLWPDSEEWPRDGEVDIMEVPGENRAEAHFVLHWDEANHMHGTSLAGDYSQWHTFAVEWLPDRITWFVDGVKQYENTDKAAIPTTPMHLTIQLDRGPKKDWIDAPDETTPEKVALEVDWVRIFAPE